MLHIILGGKVTLEGQLKICACPALILLILWSITQLFNVNVYHDHVVCCAQNFGLQLKGQGHT